MEVMHKQAQGFQISLRVIFSFVGFLLGEVNDKCFHKQKSRV